MEAFAILILIFIILALFYEVKGKQHYNVYLLICFSLLLLLRLSINWKNWGDLPEYYYAFSHTLSHSYTYYNHQGWSVPEFKSEQGWIIYTWLLSIISSNFFFFLLITGIIILGSYYFIIKKYVIPKLFLVSVLLYTIGSYLQSFYVLRQHMAMALVLFCYPYIINRYFVKFLVVVLISSAIHQTALFIIPLYFMYGINRKPLLFFSFAIYAIAVFAIVSYIGETADLFIDGYNKYLHANEEEFTNYKSAALLIGVLFIRIIAIKKNFWDDGITKLLSIILIIGCINAILGVGRVMFMSRLNMYYSSIIFLLLPNTMHYMKTRSFRILFALSYIIIMGYFFFARYNTYQIGGFIWD